MVGRFRWRRKATRVRHKWNNLRYVLIRPYMVFYGLRELCEQSETHARTHVSRARFHFRFRRQRKQSIRFLCFFFPFFRFCPTLGARRLAAFIVCRLSSQFIYSLANSTHTMRRLHQMCRVAWLMFTFSFPQLSRIALTHTLTQKSREKESFKSGEEEKTGLFHVYFIHLQWRCRFGSFNVTLCIGKWLIKWKRENWSAHEKRLKRERDEVSTILLLTCLWKRKSFRFVVYFSLHREPAVFSQGASRAWNSEWLDFFLLHLLLAALARQTYELRRIKENTMRCSAGYLCLARRKTRIARRLFFRWMRFASVLRGILHFCSDNFDVVCPEDQCAQSFCFVSLSIDIPHPPAATAKVIDLKEKQFSISYSNWMPSDVILISPISSLRTSLPDDAENTPVNVRERARDKFEWDT